jgi:hypothetical protein
MDAEPLPIFKVSGPGPENTLEKALDAAKYEG